jgi:short-subunit dehydrogenase
MEGLHLELEGTGVQTGIVLPGFVSEAGMFVDRRGTAPRLIGASPAADVAQAVVRVIERGRQEVIVSPGPIRPFLVLSSLSPALSDRILKWLGVVKVKRWMYEHQRAG